MFLNHSEGLTLFISKGNNDHHTPFQDNDLEWHTSSSESQVNIPRGTGLVADVTKMLPWQTNSVTCTQDIRRSTSFSSPAALSASPMEALEVEGLVSLLTGC
jgi:hypothetical protein